MKRKIIAFLMVAFVFYSVVANSLPMFSLNKDFSVVDTFWDPDTNYHNDVLIYTTLRNKTVVCNSDSWYTNYYDVFAKGTELRSDLPSEVAADGLNIDDFEDLGGALAYIHSTLVDEAVRNTVTETDVPHLYICLDGVGNADKVVALNDSNGNMYLMTEDYWDAICEQTN